MRILLCYPGGEVTLFRYKKPVPAQTASKKLASIASEIFSSWQWLEGNDAMAIEALESQEKMLILVDSPAGKECFI